MSSGMRVFFIQISRDRFRSRTTKSIAAFSRGSFGTEPARVRSGRVRSPRRRRARLSRSGTRPCRGRAWMRSGSLGHDDAFEAWGVERPAAPRCNGAVSGRSAGVAPGARARGTRRPERAHAPLLAKISARTAGEAFAQTEARVCAGSTASILSEMVMMWPGSQRPRAFRVDPLGAVFALVLCAGVRGTIELHRG